MLYLPSETMFPNRFVETVLPTKAQIFARTGQRSVAPNGVYTGDESVGIGMSATEKAEAFARQAESYERPKPAEPSE